MRQMIFLTAVFLLTSCDCFISSRGKVVDQQTKKPLRDVNVYMIIKKATLQNLAYNWDSLTIKERDSVNHNNPELKTKWKNEGWHYPISDVRKYVKNIPCITDSIGNYDLYFFGSYCPKYSIKFTKTGYKDLIIPRDSLPGIHGDHEKRPLFELIPE